jgi:molybdenum cofactor biosynthesis enzyme MoaA
MVTAFKPPYNTLGFSPLKLNVVVNLPGVNDNEILDLAALKSSRDGIFRFY